MAPLGMVNMSAWLTSPEVGVISLIVFLILSIVLVALCTACERRKSNAYDMNDVTTDGAGGANGTAATKSGGPNDQGTITYRSHKDMPVNTLERTRTVTN